MAFDMKVFEDLLGSDMSDEYRSLLGNISNSTTAPQTDATASIYGFEPGRNSGVKSLAEQVDARNNKWHQDQVNHMMKSEQDNAAKRAKAQQDLMRDAQLQSARNQLNNAAQISGKAAHGQLGMNMFNSALQQEKMRQGRDEMSWPEIMAGKAMNGMLGMMGPMGSLAQMSIASRNAPTTNQINTQGAMASLGNGYTASGKRKQPTAGNAAQRQSLMQQMLRGSFGK